MNDLTPTQGTLALTHKFPAEERDLLNYFTAKSSQACATKSSVIILTKQDLER